MCSTVKQRLQLQPWRPQLNINMYQSLFQCYERIRLKKSEREPRSISSIIFLPIAPGSHHPVASTFFSCLCSTVFPATKHKHQQSASIQAQQRAERENQSSTVLRRERSQQAGKRMYHPTSLLGSSRARIRCCGRRTETRAPENKWK